MSEELPKRAKRPMTDKQKVARLANLEKGRKTRQENIQKRKEPQDEEYDLDTESDDESDDDDDFILSKVKHKLKPSKNEKKPDKNELKDDVNQLKDIVEQLVVMQKKKTKKANKPRNSTKIVMLPPSVSAASASNTLLEQLRKSLM